ncbi:MAG: V4R domain-containing protein [Candidatus Altiarchaeota archaeon]
MGYYAAEIGCKIANIDKLVHSLSRSALFWKIFENKKIRGAYSQGFLGTNAAILDLIKIDKNKRCLRFTVRDSTTSHLQSPKKCCFIEVGALCGINEVLFNGFWNGVENKCHCVGDDVCEFDVFLHENEVEPKFQFLSKEEVNKIFDYVLSNIVERKTNLRDNLPDTVHAFIDQIINYLMISASPGHIIISKHAGVVSGKHIVEKSGISGRESTFSYIQDLFSYLRVGILHGPDGLGDKISLRMDESVYASGVNNIGMKLDVFLAGIIEGVLCEAMGEKWRVEETKCLANGDDFCEFSCKRLQ